MENQKTRNWKTISVFFSATAICLIFYLNPVEIFAPVPATLIQLLRSFFLLLALFILFERLFTMEIYTKIMLGLLLGAAAGILFQAEIVEIKPVGTAFIRLIRMIIIPLVFASLLVGTASLGDPKKMGRIGIKTMVYYQMEIG